MKALIDKVESGLYERLFDENFVQGHGEVYIIGEAQPEKERAPLLNTDWCDPLLRIPDKSEWDHEKLQTLREKVNKAKKECPYVPIVEAIDKSGILALSSVLNSGPVFLAHHIAGALEDKTFVKLKAAFSNSAVGEGPTRDQKHHKGCADLSTPQQVHIEGSYSERRPCKNQETVWPLSNPRRVHYGVFSKPMMSICQVASHTCKECIMRAQ